MDPRWLDYYEQELAHLKEMGAEFAREFPKIAGRLTLEGFECSDPYVERLLEGFSFLSARLQLKIDTEFPRFTQHLLEMVYPHYLSPTPSMAIARFEPKLAESALLDGFTIPRQTQLTSRIGKGDTTSCEYRTAQDLTLWPIEITDAEYFTGTVDVVGQSGPDLPPFRAGIRLKLTSAKGAPFEKMALDRLAFHVMGSGEQPYHIYQQIFADGVGVVARPLTRPAPWHTFNDEREIGRVGFGEDEALLPHGPRSFQGYRLLREYFAFPQRFMFFELSDLSRAVRRCEGHELELIILLSEIDPVLENAVDRSHFEIFAVPAINLFPRQADRIQLNQRQTEYHVIPDRTRPLDFEVYQVDNAIGYRTGGKEEVSFLPFYACNDLASHRDHNAYFAIRRMPRVLSSKQRRFGPRSSYVGGEVFLSLVDADEAPYHPDLKQLEVGTLCTNRDLPLHMPVGQGRSDFTMASAAPVEGVSCLAGPTRPQPSTSSGEAAWRIISHLSLNYLSLMDDESGQGAAALREMLMLYGGSDDAAFRKQIEGVASATARPITKQISAPGRVAFARGLEVTVQFEESAFGGSSFFLLGAVLDQFFRKYVSINSFTETVIRLLGREKEVIRWPVRIGRRHLL